MSELRVNKITSNIPGQNITIGTGVVIGDETKGQFEVTDYGAIKFLGPLFLGTQTGNTAGGTFEMVSSSGDPKEPAKWNPFRYNCPVIQTGIPTNSIFRYLVQGYYDGCSSNTVDFPAAPTGFYYCDGSNGTPDFRTVNPLTGQLSFEGGCNTTTSYNGTWTLTYIIKV
jgi:hypothetical protein